MSAFATNTPLFEAFLERAKDGHEMPVSWTTGSPRNARFIPRNFLIDERLDLARVETYQSVLASKGSVDWTTWNAVHNEYLRRHVFVCPPAGHDYRSVALSDLLACPETFRSVAALIPFGATDLDVDFIRLVPVSDLAYLSREDEAAIFSLGQQVVGNPDPTSVSHAKLRHILDEAFFGARCDRRPVFAAFYEDFLNELADPNHANWANRMRDRLGLFHISQHQPGGLPRRVFLFRYAVRDLPRQTTSPSVRPIAVPVVIDHRLSEAFCPAPRELDRVRLLNLIEGATDEPAREVLHLSMPMQPEALFRVGLASDQPGAG